ncbi:MAG TPA: coproporphyrinogen dehydrogenase HemZ [Clostridiaceae bacterium]|nr:coproporphyrinogen dehydrogenase HemZ [Clostridiaceae bacterium]
MIQIFLEEQMFYNEVYDEVKLFFNENEICFTDELPPDEKGGIFLYCKVDSEAAEGPVFRINLEWDNSSYNADIPIESKNIGEMETEKVRELKRQIKRHIYLALVKCTGRELPWGMLTGIRPAKIARELLEEGKTEEEILSTLTRFYMLSEEKARLAYGVALTESKIINRTGKDMISVYIGIPFCPSRCLYCSFTSNPIAKCSHLVSKYLDALKSEINGVQRIIEEKSYKIQSLYIGGGTPTSIDTVSLEGLLEHINKTFNMTWIEEFTLEAGRPDSISKDKLEAAKNYGVNRISINPQTMNNRTLEIIGRSHTAEDIIEAFGLAREAGFDCINMDIIVGLPGENLLMFEHTLKEIGKLNPENLTVHTMAIKRASRLNEHRSEYNLISGEEAEQMVNMAREFANSIGMHPYYLYRQKNILGNLENIGYCKPGYESIYNIQIMEEKQTIIALGAGAVTKVVYPSDNRIERAFNVKNIEEYINRLDEMIERKKALLNP